MPEYRKTHREVAEYFDVSIPTVRSWFAQGCPGKTSKGYCLDQIIDWRHLRQKRVTDLTKGNLTAEQAALEKLRAEARIKEADATLKEHRTKLATDRSLVDRAVVERFVSQFLTQARKLIEKTEHSIVASVPGKYQQQLREELVAQHQQYLRNLHAYLLQVADLGDDEK